MLKRLLGNGRRIVFALVAVVSVAILAACAPLAKVAYLEALPMYGFATSVNPDVHYEQGAEQLAGEIAHLYPDAIALIERTHGSSFGKLPEIYVCATEECYKKYAFVPVARGETRPRGNTVMLNGLQLSQDGTGRAILTHELSHAYWYSRGIRCLPRWWEEGLAVWASAGGGAEKSPLLSATQAIRAGHVFHPSSESSCFFANSAAKYGLDWPLYYRQAGMFIAFIHNRNSSSFNSVLESLRAGTDLAEAVQTAYGQSIEMLWNAWHSSITEA